MPLSTLPYSRVEENDSHRKSPSALGPHFGHELVFMAAPLALVSAVGVPPAAGISHTVADGLS